MFAFALNRDILIFLEMRSFKSTFYFPESMNSLDPAVRRRLERLVEFRGGKTVEQYVGELSRLSRRVLKSRRIKVAARVFAAVSDPVRISILKLLRGRRMCVCELMIALGLSQPAISYHLKLLRGCGLVRPVRSGRWVFYEIASRRLANLIFKLVESV